MKELVEVMAKSLVSNPSAVVVEEEPPEHQRCFASMLLLKIWVSYWKTGRIAKAIRTVMKAVATRENVKLS